MPVGVSQGDSTRGRSGSNVNIDAILDPKPIRRLLSINI